MMYFDSKHTHIFFLLTHILYLYVYLIWYLYSISKKSLDMVIHFSGIFYLHHLFYHVSQWPIACATVIKVGWQELHHYEHCSSNHLIHISVKYEMATCNLIYYEMMNKFKFNRVHLNLSVLYRILNTYNWFLSLHPFLFVLPSLKKQCPHCVI